MQTYQRESKPIQDVYSQVTQLFREAPDLLEDFKQFLPESAAQARAAAAAKAAQEDPQNGASAGPSGPTATRLPAVGTFAPPPTLGKKDPKKRAQAVSHVQEKLDAQPRPAASKRTKVAHHKPTLEQQIASVSPTLTPFHPEPLGPPPAPSATTEELAFFDRVKKFIGNKQTYNEFLKLLNLFSQGLIDKAILVEKVHSFIGGNPELIAWFKRFVQWEDKNPEVVENDPRLLNKVRLSVCRALGPSYRLLPRLEQSKPCSGRDEMCWEVLNDQWASHPTWASEDSGFVAHKKNQYEETLHRIEEERHDYDHNIEANLRTIQLLEPIAQRIANMTAEEKASFRLPPGLGGQSTTIYQRLIKKVYDREKGQEVIDHLHNSPAITVPVVLKRLKQKDEEWKAAQREWQKVWRDQTSRAFWKSLDHQGITIKATDKKAISQKALTADIQAVYKQQQSSRISATTPLPDWQFKFDVKDEDVVLDAVKLLIVSLEHNSSFSMGDREKVDAFVRMFIPFFFGIDHEKVELRCGKGRDEEAEDSVIEDTPGSPAANQTPRRPRQHRDTQDLLRHILRRHKKPSNSRKETSARVSRDSSHDPNTPHDSIGDAEMTSPTSSTNAHSAREEGTWITRPLRHDSRNPSNPSLSLTPTMDLDDPAASSSSAPQKRTTFTLFANTTLYCLFRLLYLLIDRLTKLKESEPLVRADINSRKQHKPADALKIASSIVQNIFPDTSDNANYYQQTLDMCEKFIEGELESQVFEEQIRQVSNFAGWRLYTVDRVCNAVLKFCHAIVPGVGKEHGGAAGGQGEREKERNADIVLRYEQDRRRGVTGAGEDDSDYMELMRYRKYVEDLVGPDETIYRIDWVSLPFPSSQPTPSR